MVKVHDNCSPFQSCPLSSCYSQFLSCKSWHSQAIVFQLASCSHSWLIIFSPHNMIKFHLLFLPAAAQPPHSSVIQSTLYSHSPQVYFNIFATFNLFSLDWVISVAFLDGDKPWKHEQTVWGPQSNKHSRILGHPKFGVISFTLNSLGFLAISFTIWKICKRQFWTDKC